MILICYSITFLPYLIVFYIENLFYNIIDDVIDAAFFIDIFICFNTTYRLENNSFETSRRNIALKYLKSYFFLDFISSIPLRYIITEAEYIQDFNKFFRVVKIPKLIGVIRILKMFNLANLL